MKNDRAHNRHEPTQRRGGGAREDRGRTDESSGGGARATTSVAPPPPDDVIRLAPNVVSVKHWDRLLGGALYAATPRVPWANLLRRSFCVDVLECPACRGRLRLRAVITERESARRILERLGMATGTPPIARARDPTDDELSEQLTLDIA